eukprot:1691729-Rhodomonas_salina.1
MSSSFCCDSRCLAAAYALPCTQPPTVAVTGRAAPAERPTQPSRWAAEGTSEAGRQTAGRIV